MGDTKISIKVEQISNIVQYFSSKAHSMQIFSQNLAYNRRIENEHSINHKKDLHMSTNSIWEPDAAHTTQMQEFMEFVNQKHMLLLQTYAQLHHWSIQEISNFWQDLAEFYQIKFHSPPEVWFKPAKKLWQAQWLTGARLNYAENIIARGQEGLAISAIREDGQTSSIDFASLRQQVAAVAAMLKAHDIQIGDCVVGITTNEIPAIVAFLACASMGAIWANCSPDFGELAILERFQQLEPKLLFTVSKHTYQGKMHDHRNKIKSIVKAIPSLQTVVWLDEPHPSSAKNLAWDEFIHQEQALRFASLSFDHPLYILFSSGTTGKPKCIMHRAGGVLLEHLKDLGLHTDLRQGENLLFYTTTGWMMWNWMISALGLGSSLVLYEGSPAYPKIGHLLDLAAQNNTQVFGASAALFASLEKANYQTQAEKLKSIRTVLSTGSPLLSPQYTYLKNLFGRPLQISSISGGTDIVSCFALGNPCLPVYPGELQCLGLGMDVQIYNAKGQSVVEEEGDAS
jgi:acetoacetyl-CoA synthetase